MSDLEPEECRDLIIDLLERRLERGNNFVRSRIVSDRLNISTKQAGINLGILADRGYLEYWDENSRGVVWEINENAADNTGVPADD